MIFKFICAVVFSMLCISADKEFRKATVSKDLHNQIKWGIYLIVGIIALINSVS